MALASFTTILIIGGTGGIGESFARRFHAMNKKVIITGRRQDRLDQLRCELTGLETYQLDNTDILSLPNHLEKLIQKYPDIDTVWVNSGVSFAGDFKKTDKFSDDKIIHEINLNLTAPLIIARHFVPHLLNVTDKDSERQSPARKAHFLVTGSGLGFLPLGIFPVYCPTKAAIHSFMVGLRDSLRDTNVGVIELAVPHVRTDFSKGVPGGMELDDFTDQMMALLEHNDARQIKEAGLTFGKVAADARRKTFAPMLEARGSIG